MNNKCPTCDEMNLSTCDEEIICDNCGSAFALEYLGMYEEGSNDRIDEGFESEEWKKQYLVRKDEEKR